MVKHHPADIFAGGIEGTQYLFRCVRMCHDLLVTDADPLIGIPPLEFFAVRIRKLPVSFVLAPPLGRSLHAPEGFEDLFEFFL